MIDQFKTGNLVCCIDAGGADELEKGRIYIVETAYNGSYDQNVTLVGGGTIPRHARRFALIKTEHAQMPVDFSLDEIELARAMIEEMGNGV